MRTVRTENYAALDGASYGLKTIERLRARATRCRELGGLSVSASIAAEFARIADDYEADAFRIETTLPPNRSAAD